MAAGQDLLWNLIITALMLMIPCQLPVLYGAGAEVLSEVIEVLPAKE